MSEIVIRKKKEVTAIWSLYQHYIKIKIGIKIY